MKKLSLTILLLILLQFKGLAQEAINHYKYIIVPEKYSFFSEEDKYQLNSLLKFLFNKYGYTAFFPSDELPQDLIDNRCLALYTDVVEEKSLFKTKLRIDLKDCGGNNVMSSKVGETREKQFDKSYNLALRDAFETFQNADYKYEPGNNKSQIMEPMKATKPVMEEKRAVAEMPKTKEEKPVIKAKEDIKDVMESSKPTVEEPKMEVKQTKVEFAEEAQDILYAQPIKNGYQIVDTTPKIVMVLLETPKSDVFLVKDEDAMVYKEDGQWFISKNDGGKVSVKALNIKF